ncbi:MAG: hypothetical protein AAB225_26075, partial [Acidobacteriota bacterium]
PALAYCRQKMVLTMGSTLNFIRTTRTQTGLIVNAYLIPGHYDTGIKISDAEMRQLKLVPHDTLGRWNYTLHPTQNVN